MWEALAGNLAFSDLQLLSSLLYVIDISAWTDLQSDTNADAWFKNTELLIISEVPLELDLRGGFQLTAPCPGDATEQYHFVGSFESSFISCMVKMQLIMLCSLSNRIIFSLCFGIP